uniref:Peptidase M10 metallopeptidase domain-containing protein n=1 Tax=Panagrolaimus davidi TaxID=227884 RepID=A0A914Q0S1_9BILA
MFNKIVFGLLLLGFIVTHAAPLTNDTQTTSTNPFLNKIEILYSILNNPEGLTKYDVQRVMKKAFNAWSAAIPLTFTEVHPKNMPADIQD